MLLSFLSSLKLTITLLIIIAALSILGTVIPQEYGAGESFTRMSPGLVKTFRSLQLLDLYHSVWFIILMCLLSLNLIACSLKRFPTSWKLFAVTPSLDRARPFKDLPPDNIVMIEGEQNETASRVEHLLMKRYKRFRSKDTDTATIFYGEKGPYSHFGVYIVHASILIIIAGTIIGSLWGFGGFVNLAEGESTDTVYVGRKKSLKKLDYAVRCDKFCITYYDNGMPKEYRSDLSFLENNAVIFQGPLLVNHPVTVKGIKFYQASYGTIPGGRAHMTITREKYKATTLTVNLKDSFYLKEDGAKVTIQRVEENFMSMGPAVLLSIHSSETNMQLWVFKDIEKMKHIIPNLLQKVPKFNPGLFKPYYFKLNSIAQTYYTGLQVSYDPGVSTVAIGAFFIVIGFFFTFFSSHKRLWVRVDELEGKTRIMVSAQSNKDPVGLEREREYLLRHFKKGP
ncbi:MAG: cytochrome c biogenesis protein ResB [Deltaproteobacteria bacterium]|nr:cytochrome c biogenesis protein ResB [Deltaproteobacteria bacterium]MBW2338818.1 cytochrome c biogenesis protein ResB [Deltaproteobacteria bacterium]